MRPHHCRENFVFYLLNKFKSQQWQGYFAGDLWPNTCFHELCARGSSNFCLNNFDADGAFTQHGRKLNSIKNTLSCGRMGGLWSGRRDTPIDDFTKIYSRQDKHNRSCAHTKRIFSRLEYIYIFSM